MTLQLTNVKAVCLTTMSTQHLALIVPSGSTTLYLFEAVHKTVTNVQKGTNKNFVQKQTPNLLHELQHFLFFNFTKKKRIQTRKKLHHNINLNAK